NLPSGYLNVSFTDENFGVIVPNQGYQTGDVVFRDLSRFWVQFVLVPIVVIVGILGNTITIYILTRKSMHSSTNVYLTALAISDLFYLLFSFSMSWRHFTSINRFWLYWRYTPVGLWITDAFRCIHFTLSNLGSTSVWLTVSFTVERYVAVCHPLSGTVTLLKILCEVFYICKIVLVHFANRTYEEKDEQCQLQKHSLERTEFGKNETFRFLYHWFTTIFFVALPLLILAILNSFLIRDVRRSQIARNATVVDSREGSISARQIQVLESFGLRIPMQFQEFLMSFDCYFFQRLREESRVTVILIAVVILFIFCQLPTAAVLIYSSFTSLPKRGSVEENILLGLGNIFNLLVAINAASNWCLYTALSGKYRKYFCACFVSNTRSNPHVPGRVNNIYVLRRFHSGTYNDQRFNT
ncbi:FMRFamide receptor, partial [Orchesella cincta]